MPGRARVERSPGTRWRRQRVWAACVFVVGLLLFTWPYVRTPPLGIGQTYVHLLWSWAFVIAGLAGMARSLAGPHGGERRDG